MGPKRRNSIASRPKQPARGPQKQGPSSKSKKNLWFQKLTPKSGPLAGIRVLDLSRVLAGPLCAQHLADLGATVLKVEQPGSGDETRTWGPPFWKETSAYFLSCNRGKSPVVLDLKAANDRSRLDELLAQSDIVIENFRTASLKGLGLSPERLRRRFPKLVVCSISGFGRHSAQANESGYDFVIQALSGFMSITGEPDGEPVKAGVAIADVITSLYAATSILAAVHERARTGKGAHIDLALLDCALAAQVNLLQSFLVTGKTPARRGNTHAQIVPYQTFDCSDGTIVIAVGNDSQFARLCDVLGQSSLSADPRFAKNHGRVRERESLTAILQKVIGTWRREDLLAQTVAAGIPSSPVLSYGDFSKHPALNTWTRKSLQSTPPLIASPFRFNNTILQSQFAKDLL